MVHSSAQERISGEFHLAGLPVYGPASLEAFLYLLLSVAAFADYLNVRQIDYARSSRLCPRSRLLSS
jgi:hypothetical protein